MQYKAMGDVFGQGPRREAATEQKNSDRKLTSGGSQQHDCKRNRENELAEINGSRHRMRQSPGLVPEPPSTQLSANDRSQVPELPAPWRM